VAHVTPTELGEISRNAFYKHTATLNPARPSVRLRKCELPDLP